MDGSRDKRQPHERILVALDTEDEARALHLAGSLAGRVGGLKVGLELFSAAGPRAVRRAVDTGLEVFLDLKLHDIPNTVAGAAAAAARLGVTYLSLHALGGVAMIRRAVEAAEAAAAEAAHAPPRLLAVTVLTSLDDAALAGIGIAGPCPEAVARLAGIARSAGAAGMVCSPLEVADLRRRFPDALLVVPGIRPRGGAPAPGDDQARVAGPGRAVRLGADLVVVGRPITAAADPPAAADAIAREIEAEPPCPSPGRS